MLKVGDNAPDFAFTTVDGEPVQLSSIWEGGQNALLIFLRHLG